MSNSTAKGSAEKPRKPYSDFPLFPHATGRWAKKIRGKFVYFGRVADDPDGTAAIAKYQEQCEDLHAGRKPREKTSGLTLLDLVNKFLRVKDTLKDDGELSPRTFYGYYHCCEMLLKVLGKNRVVTDLDTEDFEKIRATAMKGLGMEARSNVVRLVRAVFNFGYNEGLIERPVRFGSAFKSPSAKSRLKDKTAKKAERILTAEQVRALIDGASVHFRAMILLGVNCGFGNHDLGTLTFSALDLDGGWHNHARPKTGVPRRAKLWPETVTAIRAAIAARRKPKDPANSDLVFITKHGAPWVRWKKQAVPDPSKSAWRDAVAIVSRILFKKLGINHGASFYSLRRMTETIGGGCKDQIGVDAVMGHSRGDMASVYRLDIEDSRLEAVSTVIHNWLFPPAAATVATATATTTLTPNGASPTAS